MKKPSYMVLDQFGNKVFSGSKKECDNYKQRHFLTWLDVIKINKLSMKYRPWLK